VVYWVVMFVIIKRSDKGNAGSAVQPIGLAGSQSAGVDHVRGHRSPPCPRRRHAQWQRPAVVDQLVQAQQINGIYIIVLLTNHFLLTDEINK